MRVGALRETAIGEHRVALDPEVVVRLVKDGREVVVESGAGTAASFPDASYERAGAQILSRAEVIATSDVLAVVRCPEASVVSALRSDQLLIGLLDPLNNLPVIETLAAKRVTAVAFELLPRTVSRAQSMDALSSQASAAGYRAAIVAAEAFGRYLPMMITASGTARPASVIVIGTGVAGLQAIATARRLGAVVTGYDVRADSREQVESLGAQFLTSSITAGAGEGGYARAMTAEEQAGQQAELAAALKSFDVIITTAKVPGRTPPLLVSAETLAALKPGSVCIDLAASDRGGNVAGSIDRERVVTPGGVIVVGAGELAADMPTSSSQMYARNVLAMINDLVTDDAIAFDLADEVRSAVVLCHAGQVTSRAVRTALKLDPVLDPPQDPLHAGQPEVPEAAAAASITIEFDPKNGQAA
ncbi:NAD(P) transhydrogenase subunit alpha [Glaciihabitans tibetensis]|uniref:proton-translocating NAD(P)(+) transhydrogenase n=1 Tax=Glaciihabitans tibetensis TaxID=1266600 RepID=A0A2T0VG02_9MICO|nr:NAD(P) transhydrogenase subunit alpha [Glaciihabitans tibetensis]PRY69125.1 NAD(P) transhydrogenase subunit alpha [Glaciihabitans tibetensis]